MSRVSVGVEKVATGMKVNYMYSQCVSVWKKKMEM